ncbi:universal stress protein [Pseudonocardia sp.]|uniref:universal stress protein n=1 Tax=Pseudonocardia sp. TaxID=60912 RepID=UPI002604C614|nr:universal stress protein [Pseudonocardia sp.]
MAAVRDRYAGPLAVEGKETVMATDRIVVGVDGSAAAHAAVDWAVRHAQRLSAGLRLVAVWAPTLPVAVPAVPLGAAPEPLSGGTAVDAAERVARTALDDAASRAAALGDRIERHLEPGEAGDVLVGHAEQADLLVLGNGRHGVLAGAVTGSVGQHCVRHAGCAVVLVPGAAG